MSVRDVWASYLAAYSDVPASERERLLRESVADDIVFSNPVGDEGKGFASLLEHVGQFQTKNPGGYFENHEMLSHHGQLLAAWTMHRQDGTQLAAARSYARFDDRGRLTHTTGFWSVPEA